MATHFQANIGEIRILLILPHIITDQVSFIPPNYQNNIIGIIKN